MSTNNFDDEFAKLKPKLRSKLHLYLRKCQWKNAIERIKQNCNVAINPNSFDCKFEYNECKKTVRTKDLPKEVKYRDEFDCLPLYIALRYGGPLHLIQLLVKANPQALRQKWNIDGGYPLHIACAPKDPIHNDLSKDIDHNQAQTIRYLCEQNMEIIDVPNEDGRVTPLHLLCEHKPPSCLVDFVIRCASDKHSCSNDSRENPCSILQMKDDQGRLPFHIAIDYQADTSVVESLYNANKKCVKIRQSVDSNLPIHIAVTEGCSPKVLKMLIQEYPQSLSKKGAFNDTPFHLLWWHYERKFLSITGKPKENKNYCDAELMLLIMMQEYYHYCCSKYKQKHSEYVIKAKRNIIYLLTSKEGYYEQQSFVDLMEKKHETYGLPRKLMTFVYNVIRDDNDWEETLDYHDVNHTQKCNEQNKDEKIPREINSDSLASQDVISDNISGTIPFHEKNDASLPQDDDVADDINVSFTDTITEMEALWKNLGDNTSDDDDDDDDDDDEKNEKARVRAYAFRHLNTSEEKSITTETSNDNDMGHEYSQSKATNFPVMEEKEYSNDENELLEQFFSQIEDFVQTEREDINKNSKIETCETSKTQNERKNDNYEKESFAKHNNLKKETKAKDPAKNIIIDLCNEKNFIDLSNDVFPTNVRIKTNDDKSYCDLKLTMKKEKPDITKKYYKENSLRSVMNKSHEDNQSWYLRKAFKRNKRKRKNQKDSNIQNGVRNKETNKEGNKEEYSSTEITQRKSTRKRTYSLSSHCDTQDVLDDFLITV